MLFKWPWLANWGLYGASSYDGKTVAQCFELVSRVGLEIEGLSQMLQDMITTALGETRSLPCTLAGPPKYDSRNDDSDWVCTDEAWSFPLKGLGRGRTTKMYICFQISLTGDGIAIPGNAEPLLHVYSSNAACSFDNSDYIGVPLDDERPAKIINHRLLLWDSEELSNWNECEWAYSLRLMSLNSRGELKKHVIEPMLALLGGADVQSALPDSLTALVKYPELNSFYNDEIKLKLR